MCLGIRMHSNIYFHDLDPIYFTIQSFPKHVFTDNFLGVKIFHILESNYLCTFSKNFMYILESNYLCTFSKLSHISNPKSKNPKKLNCAKQVYIAKHNKA